MMPANAFHVQVVQNNAANHIRGLRPVADQTSPLPFGKKLTAYPPSCEFSDGRTASVTWKPWLLAPPGELAAAAALFAAQRAFIVAESCARRSGERLSLFFTFRGAAGLAAADCFAATGRFLGELVGEAFAARVAPACAANFFRALAASAANCAASFRFNLASFLGPSESRVSSRRIFFFRVLDFI